MGRIGFASSDGRPVLLLTLIKVYRHSYTHIIYAGEPVQESKDPIQEEAAKSLCSTFGSLMGIK